MEKLPKNWAEIPFGEIILTKKGKKPKKTITEPTEGYLPYILIHEMEGKGIRSYTNDEKVPVVNKEDVLLVWDGSIGKCSSGLHGAIGSTLVAITPLRNIPTRLIEFFIKYKNQYIHQTSTGTGLQHINKNFFKDCLISLPPLAEQQRIVAKLDGLFGHLDSLKQRLELIPTLLKQFRQSVLTQAVTGKLTEEWRGSKSVVIDSPITIGDEFQEKPKNWIWCNLIDIAKLESGHTPRKSKEEYWINGDVPWISLQDIRAAHGTIITDTKYKPNMVGINNSSARLLPKGTVCFSRDISVGYTTIMGKEMATTQHFANWICREKLFNKYLLYAFISAKDFLIASGRGTTVKTIYMPALKQFRLLRPPIEEQTEIVKRVESLFVKADTIEAAYDKLKQQIDNLPQAILAKAFKGELVAQLPTDGDAKDLLKEIATLRASLEKEKKSKKKKKINA
jgi:type I restriction enzyme, S subunit